MSTKYVFSDHDREHGKRVGLQRRHGDFRCYECIDFSFYEREANEHDAEERCTYCGGYVYLTPEMIAEIAPVKPVRPVNLDKGHARKFDLLSIAHNLRTRLDEVSYALDKANQRIAELEAERPSGPMVYLVDTGAGSLVEMSYREISELRAQGLTIEIAQAFRA
ncbi:hypothetical protein ACPCAA_17840 [Streptomyces griseoincarnatus]